MGSVGCPEMLVRSDNYSLCNNPEERISVYKEVVWQAAQGTAFPLYVITFSMAACHIHQV
jgi:hypothetical protein